MGWLAPLTMDAQPLMRLIRELPTVSQRTLHTPTCIQQKSHFDTKDYSWALFHNYINWKKKWVKNIYMKIIFVLLKDWRAIIYPQGCNVLNTCPDINRNMFNELCRYKWISMHMRSCTYGWSLWAITLFYKDCVRLQCIQAWFQYINTHSPSRKKVSNKSLSLVFIFISAVMLRTRPAQGGARRKFNILDKKEEILLRDFLVCELSFRLKIEDI